LGKLSKFSSKKKAVLSSGSLQKLQTKEQPKATRSRSSSPSKKTVEGGKVQSKAGGSSPKKTLEGGKVQIKGSPTVKKESITTEKSENVPNKKNETGTKVMEYSDFLQAMNVSESSDRGSKTVAGAGKTSASNTPSKKKTGNQASPSRSAKKTVTATKRKLESPTVSKKRKLDNNPGSGVKKQVKKSSPVVAEKKLTKKPSPVKSPVVDKIKAKYKATAAKRLSGTSPTAFNRTRATSKSPTVGNKIKGVTKSPKQESKNKQPSSTTKNKTGSKSPEVRSKNITKTVKKTVQKTPTKPGNKKEVVKTTPNKKVESKDKTRSVKKEAPVSSKMETRGKSTTPSSGSKTYSKDKNPNTKPKVTKNTRVAKEEDSDVSDSDKKKNVGRVGYYDAATQKVKFVDLPLDADESGQSTSEVKPTEEVKVPVAESTEMEDMTEKVEDVEVSDLGCQADWNDIVVAGSSHKLNHQQEALQVERTLRKEIEKTKSQIAKRDLIIAVLRRRVGEMNKGLRKKAREQRAVQKRVYEFLKTVEDVKKASDKMKGTFIMDRKAGSDGSLAAVRRLPLSLEGQLSVDEVIRAAAAVYPRETANMQPITAQSVIPLVGAEFEISVNRDVDDMSIRFTG